MTSEDKRLRKRAFSVARRLPKHCLMNGMEITADLLIENTDKIPIYTVVVRKENVILLEKAINLKSVATKQIEEIVEKLIEMGVE